MVVAVVPGGGGGGGGGTLGGTTKIDLAHVITRKRTREYNKPTYTQNRLLPTDPLSPLVYIK